MKRDLELIRKIALAIESIDPKDNLTEMADIDQYVFAEHVRLMVDANLIEAEIQNFLSGDEPTVWVTRLTMRGYDFIDAARSETVWKKVRELVISKGIPWTIDILIERLKSEVMNRFPTLS